MPGSLVDLLWHTGPVAEQLQVVVDVVGFAGGWRNPEAVGWPWIDPAEQLLNVTYSNLVAAVHWINPVVDCISDVHIH